MLLFDLLYSASMMIAGRLLTLFGEDGIGRSIYNAINRIFFIFK